MEPRLEREPGEKEFAPTPADGSRPSTNPPPFRWLSHRGVSRWRVELSGPGGRRMEFGPLRDPILALRKRLPPGEWSWRFVGLDAAGREAGRGDARRFSVKRGLGGFAAPDAGKLEKKWRGLRPRLFAKRIALVREHLDGEFAAPAARLAEWCRLAEKQPPIPDPASFGPFAEDTEEHNRDWWRILSAGKVASAHAVRFALSHLLTGSARHLDALIEGVETLNRLVDEIGEHYLVRQEGAVRYARLRDLLPDFQRHVGALATTRDPDLARLNRAGRHTSACLR